MKYQWDPNKARANLQKHGVDFADAVGVFEDEWAFTFEEQEVAGECRFVTRRRKELGYDSGRTALRHVDR